MIFGAAFLSKENIESFVWVFERFNECMGRAPVTIITDHDPTMKAALNNVFPRTFHRLCKWYITDKMEDKIGNVYGNKASMSEFYDLLNNSKSIIEFEWRWDVWKSNRWLRDIYEIRFNWRPPYMTRHFFAGMSTTQKSEEMDNIVKMMIKSHFTL